MNREIKFRALFQSIKDTGQMVWQFVTVNQTASTIGWVRKSDWLQYTGLKDKNDKDIYEGDIVKAKYSTMSWGNKMFCEFTGVIMFGDFESVEYAGIFESICGWYVLCGNTKKSLGEHNDELEVIGHMVENPELLEEN